MRRRSVLLVAVCALLCVQGIGLADIVKIELIFGQGLISNYNASSGSQNLISTNGAYVFTSDPYAAPIQFTHTDIGGSCANITDTSSGGTASASFGSGTWYVKLYDPANASHLVLSISGTVDWYDELETGSNAVDGRGVVTIVPPVFTDSVFWNGATWGSTNGKSGIISSITGAVQGGGNLTNYQSNWSSNNVSLFIYADSNAIPEPATMALLGLGAFALRRMKR